MIFIGLVDAEEKLEFLSATSHLRILTTKEINAIAGVGCLCLHLTAELGYEGDILVSVTWHF